MSFDNAVSAPGGAPADGPSGCAHEVRLPEGVRVRIRPIRPGDAGRLVAFYDRLSRHTAYQRFFTVMKRLPPDWARMLATVDYRRRFALVAECGSEVAPELVAVARYEPTDRQDTVEVAFVVQDNWQGRGLGTVLLHELLAAAAARGIRRFIAYVLADNRRMLDLLCRFTEVQERTLESGVVKVVFGRRSSARAEAPAATGRDHAAVDVDGTG